MDNIFVLSDVSDTRRPDSAQTIHEMKKMGFNVVILTGDNSIVTSALCPKAGIEKI